LSLTVRSQSLSVSPITDRLQTKGGFYGALERDGSE
jgi:hypothetical protein